MKTLIIALSFISLACYSQKSQWPLVPYPEKVVMGKGHFTINSKTEISVPDIEWITAIKTFNEQLQVVGGYKLKVTTTTKSGANTIRCITNKSIANEGYKLAVKGKTILIEASTPNGLFYAFQTMRQLLPISYEEAILQPELALNIPNVMIEDAPRFSYRGMHLDVCRHFFSVAFVKKYIDRMASHKFNRFHWHLTDDQGWRIEIKKYPKLAEVSAWRNGTVIGSVQKAPFPYDTIRYGGYYSQEQIKEVVQYAKERFVTIIPEIEMPGHAMAALAAYPELSCSGGPFEVAKNWGVFKDVFCTREETFNFLQDVLSEVIPLFPSEYIHIGGDECPKLRWSRCAACQKRMAEHSIKTENELQNYFMTRIEKFLNSNGKQIIGWDEILEGGLAPNATVMSWRGVKGGINAAKQHHNVIMTPNSYLYFDYYQADKKTQPLAIGSFNPLSKVYSYEPVPEELTADEAKYIIGAQANVWTEFMATESYVEYMVFPRMCALSEVVWSPKAIRNFEDFNNRLSIHKQRLAKQGINFYPGE